MAIRHDIADDILLHCDRTRSAEARFALERLVWKPMQANGLGFTSDCLLLRKNDILYAQESSKFRRGDGLWVCQLCMKVFINEHFLDKHFSRKHAVLRRDNGTVCLADLCGVIIPCLPLYGKLWPTVASKVQSSVRDAGALSEQAIRPEICNDTVLRKRQIASCVEVIRHCLATPNNLRLGYSTERALKRLRRDLCERAIDVGCVPRENVWDIFGRPERYLQPGTDSPVAYFSFVALTFLLLCVGSWAFRRLRMKERHERNRSRRRKRSRARQ